MKIIDLIARLSEHPPDTQVEFMVHDFTSRGIETETHLVEDICKLNDVVMLSEIPV